MHGLINRSIQSFVCETYGAPAWEDIAVRARLGFQSFEALMSYDDQLTYDVIDAACAHLGKPRDAFLEDLGTFLCSNPRLEAVRRLLRFGGDTFSDFLCSLDDLPDRVRLAVPELEMPIIHLRASSPGYVIMRVGGDFPGFGHVLVGIMRAMADDYGTLALLEHKGNDAGEEVISIQMLQAGFSQGRSFDLTAKAAE